jgi:hypothetical protein
VKVAISKNVLRVGYKEKQAEHSSENTREYLPSKGKIDCAKTLLCCQKYPDSEIDHQDKKDQLEKIPDDSEYSQQLRGEKVVDE